MQIQLRGVIMWKIGERILNTYIVEELLGQGGVASVYRVRRLSDNVILALKTIKPEFLENPDIQQMFFNEIRIWIDLPAHPNIAACRFFRTISGTLGIFSEYVDGKTLKFWIRNRKLKTVEQILDIAIQCARGMHAAHRVGVIHQDIKPQNILMTRDGIPKWTDFGISSIFQMDLSTGTKQGNGRFNGFTRAYCSPEQYQQKPLNPGTDIWSFGLVLAEMLLGKILTDQGYMADEALCYDADDAAHNLPEFIRPILEKCFKRDPAERWSGFQDIGNALKTVYEQVTDKKYVRRIPEQDISLPGRMGRGRKTVTGIAWQDPMALLERAYRISGRDVSKIKADISHLSGNGTVPPAVADLGIYKIAENIYNSVLKQGNTRYQDEFARLLMNKALIQENASDWKGAVETRDKALKLFEDMVFNQGKNDFAETLAGIYLRQAWVLTRIGNANQALNYYDKSLAIRNALVETDKTLLPELAKVYMNKGLALCKLKNQHDSRACFQTALDIMEQCASESEDPQDKKTLAKFYLDHAVTSAKYIGPEKLVTLLGKSLDIAKIYLPLDTEPDDPHFTSSFYIKLAILAREAGNFQVSLRYFNAAIHLMERVVYQEEQQELLGELATAYSEKALLLKDRGNPRSAGFYVDEAIRILEKMVYQQGHDDQIDALSKLYQTKALELQKNNVFAPAAQLFQKSTDLLKWLIAENGQSELKEYLAKAHLYHADLFRTQQDYHSAAQIYKPAVDILKELVYQSNRHDLRLDYIAARLNLADALHQTGNRTDALENTQECLKLLHATGKKTNDMKIAELIGQAGDLYRKLRK